ncbi:hypothetical protein [Reinekea sp. G2M2-21]|uniref:hypothetical protein n=1 Tax=Reinekea sp. G2M2-21 TaxID=2788942 RepID=UPI0018AA5730|nr:hypothetical protein [Reinekea sp. G2M2-21]
MLLIFAWSGILLTIIGLLNLIFFDVLPPLMTVSQSVGCILFGIVFMFVGRRHLPNLVAYLFSGDGVSGDED